MRPFPPPDPSRNLPVPQPHPSAGLPARPGYIDYHYYGAHDPEPDDQGGLLEYWRIIRRRKGTVTLIAAAGLILGVLVTLPQTPVYRATTSIEVQGLNEDFMNMRNVNPTSNSTSYYPEYDIQTQVRILQSEALADRVAKKLESTLSGWKAPESRIAAWKRALNLAQPAKPEDAKTDAIASVATKVRAQANTRLIEISADSTDPRLAADYANTLTKEFIESSLEARWDSTQKTGAWLSRQMEDTRIKLEKSEEALQAYARQAGLLFTAEKDNVAEQKLKQLQDELSKAQADRVAKQARYELASRTSADALGEVLDSVVLKDTQSKLTDLRRQLAETTSVYTASHPRVKKILEQIAVLDTALERERSNIVRRIGADFESAQRRERLLNTDYAKQVGVMTGQADQVAHYNLLKREVETNRQMYDTMLQRVKEAGVASALQASNVRVVDPAKQPEAPVKPRPAVNAALGVVVGLFFGAVFVVTRERSDGSIKEPGDVLHELGIPELGTVPSALADPLNKRRGLLPSKRQNPEASQCLELVTFQRKPSLMAEAFRTTLTSILFQNGAKPHPQILVLSSAAPREGKTTVCTNLAIALAEIHKRVLVIDADLRKPRIHDIFDLENTTGLVDLLRRSDPIIALNGEVSRTDIPNLSVITSGQSEHGDTTLFHSTRLRELLQVAKQTYDMVVIDTPPMLNMADARVIAKHADGVVLVARANQTSREALRNAYQSFSADGSLVIGAIMNDWNPATSSRDYRGYKSYNSYSRN